MLRAPFFSVSDAELFDAVERMPLLPLYTLSNEPSLGFAADACARMRGDSFTFSALVSNVM